MPGKSGSRRSWRRLAATHEDYLETVVDWLPLHDADRAFQRWLDESGLRRRDIAPRDLRIDTGRGETGSVRRYRVHLDVIRRAANERDSH